MRTWRTQHDGTPASLLTMAVLAVLILLYALAMKHNRPFDVTRYKRYTLAEQSINLLQSLQQPINIIGFFRRKDPRRETFIDLLKLYTQHTEQITYALVDLDRNPVLAERHHITADHTILITGYGKEEKIFRLAEDAFTNAILQLTHDTEKVVYFVTGHGEAGLTDTEHNGYSVAKQQLEAQHYDVKDLLLVHHHQIPPDATVVIVAGPHRDFLERELDVLRAFLTHGGHLLLMLDPYTVPGLHPFLTSYGLDLGNDIIIEPNSLLQLLGGDYLIPAVMTYAEHHPIVKDLRRLMTLFPLVRSVRVVQESTASVQAESLAFTSPDSWAETDLTTLEQEKRATFDEQSDQRGPISIAVAVTMAGPPASRSLVVADHKTRLSANPSSARLVVFGDSEFANNTYFALQGNGDLFLKTVNWLAEEKDFIAVRPRQGEGGGPVILTAAQAPLIFWVPVVLLPLTIFASGLVVCLKRRWQQ
jgi:ABC-type uncharacterized transport system involved in gliding motility auxiliary subunit